MDAANSQNTPSVGAFTILSLCPMASAFRSLERSDELSSCWKSTETSQPQYTVVSCGSVSRRWLVRSPEADTRIESDDQDEATILNRAASNPHHQTVRGCVIRDR